MPEGIKAGVPSKLLIPMSAIGTPNLRWLPLPFTDLSIKLEVGREEDMGEVGMSGKQRSFSMDLSPSEPPFGGLGGPPVWSLPSPSHSAQHAQQQHDLNINVSNAQSTADGELAEERL
jgi:hypothetical protein